MIEQLSSMLPPKPGASERTPSEADRQEKAGADRQQRPAAAPANEVSEVSAPASRNVLHLIHSRQASLSRQVIRYALSCVVESGALDSVLETVPEPSNVPASPPPFRPQFS